MSADQVKDKAFRGITSIFTDPRHAMSLKGWLDSVHTHATKVAWKEAVRRSPTPEVFAGAMAAKVYDKGAVLAPAEPTRKWLEDQVHARGQLIADGPQKNAAALVGIWVNLTLVTRDGVDHCIRVREGLRPWPPTREAGEASVVEQALEILGLELEVRT